MVPSTMLCLLLFLMRGSAIGAQQLLWHQLRVPWEASLTSSHALQSPLICPYSPGVMMFHVQKV